MARDDRNHRECVYIRNLFSNAIGIPCVSRTDLQSINHVTLSFSKATDNYHFDERARYCTATRLRRISIHDRMYINR